MVVSMRWRKTLREREEEESHDTDNEKKEKKENKRAATNTENGEIKLPFAIGENNIHQKKKRHSCDKKSELLGEETPLRTSAAFCAINEPRHQVNHHGLVPKCPSGGAQRVDQDDSIQEARTPALVLEVHKGLPRWQPQQGAVHAALRETL